MSRASQDTIHRHGRQALEFLLTGPQRTSDIAKRLKIELRVAQRLIHSLKIAGYPIETLVDGTERRHSLSGQVFLLKNGQALIEMATKKGGRACAVSP